VNGHQIVSGQGRAFNFLDLSPDFVSAVEVQKSPTPDMEEGGLSGTVNIHTPQPLDSKRSTIAGRVEGIYNENRKAAGPRISAIGTYVNDAGTFGVNLGVGYEKRKLLAYDLLGYGAETGVESGKVPNVDYNLDGDFNDKYAFDHAQSYYIRRNDRTRFSVVGGLQYKPADNIELYANGLYSYFKDVDNALDAATRYTNIAPATPGGPFGIRGSTIDTSFNDQLLGGAQGFLTSVDADGLDIRADAQPSVNRNRVLSGSLGAKVSLGRLHVKLEGDYSKGTAYNLSFLPSVIGRGSAIITHPGGLGGGPDVTFDRGYDPLNPANFAFNTMYEGKNYNRDQMGEAKLDLSYDLGTGFFRALRAGAYYSNRHFTFRQFTAQTDAQTLAALSNGKLVYQPDIEQGSVNAAPILSVASYKTGIPYFLPSFLIFDFDKFFAIIPRSALEAASPPTEQLGAGLNVREKTTAGYVMTDFGGFADRLSGNAGVRFVHTALTSSGFGSDLNNLTIAPGGVQTIVPAGGRLDSKNTYSYFLPSLNAKYDISPNLGVRFAAARVLARPEFGQLGVGLSVNANVLSISASNPDLKPYLANQLDLSFEYYMPHSGLVSLAFFYKDVKNFIVNGQTLDTRTASRSDGSKVTLVFRRNQPINLEKVKIKGIELGVQLPLYFLPNPLDGFGIFGNGTYIDAPRVPAEQDGLPFTLPGVSKFSYNAGIYFEKWGVGARAYYNWRGKYDTGVEDYFGDREFQKPYGQMDGSISYDVTHAVSVSLDFENLTNSVQRQENNFGLARQYLLTGRRFTLGVRGKF
jgi:iron complex outermembrane receptor protein